MSNTYPPPQDGLPEYAFGRLIYYDHYGDDNCRWVVYDGDKRVRCPDRTSAVRYCAEVATKVDDDRVTWLLICNDELRRCYTHIERLSERMPAEERLLLGTKAVELRRIFDQLDQLASQLIKPK